MATTAFKGNPVNTAGDLPAAGASAPAFDLVGDGLSELTSGDLSGRVVLNIFPHRHGRLRRERAEVQRARREP